jgi:integrase
MASGQEAAKRGQGIDFSDKSFPFTEARIEQARRLVTDGTLDTDASGRRTWRDSSPGGRGLALVVNEKTGGAVFYFIGTGPEGRTVRRAIGDAAVVRLDEARTAVGRSRYDGTAAAMLAPRPKADAPAAVERTVGEVVAEMLDAHAEGRWLPGTRKRPPTERTVKFYRDLRKARLTPHEGLTLAEFAAALPGIFAAVREAAPIQANRLAQLARNLFAYAIDNDEWTGSNPAVGGPKTNRLTRSPEMPRTKTLTADWPKLAKAIEAEGQPWCDLFLTSILSLARMGAVCGMRWDELVLEGKEASWTIPAARMKGRKAEHRIPLGEIPELLAILRARRKLVPKDCPFVFSGRFGRPVSNYKDPWRRILERAKLDYEDRAKRPRPHDLRRTGGELLVTSGVSLPVVVRALGNAPSSASMVAKTYAIAADEAMRSAYSAISTKLKSISPRRRKTK